MSLFIQITRGAVKVLVFSLCSGGWAMLGAIDVKEAYILFGFLAPGIVIVSDL